MLASTANDDADPTFLLSKLYISTHSSPNSKYVTLLELLSKSPTLSLENGKLFMDLTQALKQRRELLPSETSMDLSHLKQMMPAAVKRDSLVKGPDNHWRISDPKDILRCLSLLLKGELKKMLYTKLFEILKAQPNNFSPLLVFHTILTISRTPWYSRMN
jgi:hypothetical protein